MFFFPILQKLKIDTLVDQKNVKNTLVTYDTWLPTATQNLIKSTYLRNCNKASLSYKPNWRRRTNHKLNTDEQVRFLVLHMAQRTVALVEDIDEIVTGQMVPGRWIDKVPGMVSFCVYAGVVMGSIWHNNRDMKALCFMGPNKRYFYAENYYYFLIRWLNTCLGAQKNCLNKRVALSTQNTCWNWWIRNNSSFMLKFFAYLDLCMNAMN